MSGPNPYYIIDRAKRLAGMGGSGWDISNIIGGWESKEESDIAWGQAPAPQFPIVDITPPNFQGGFPEVPFVITDLAPPTATPGGVVTVSYGGVKSALEVSPVGTLTALAYGAPIPASEVPDVAYPPPPMDYPIEALLSLPEAAGLSEIDLDTITVGERPELYAAIINHYITGDLTPLDADIPEPDELPDPFELATGDHEEYMADASLLQDLVAASADGALIDLQTVWEPMVEAARYKAAKGEYEAFHTAAAAGFSHPTPALSAMLLEVGSTFRQELENAARGVRDDANKRALATAEQAIRKIIQLEMAHFQVYAKYVERTLKAQSFNVRMAQELLKATVDLYNRKVQALKIVLSNYGDYLQAVKKQGQTQMAWFDGVNTNLEAYEAAARSYSTQVETVGAAAELNALAAELAALPIREFVARLTGIKGNLAINKQNVESFTAAVQAYETGVQGETKAWQAYSDGVRATTSALSVHEANNRALQSFYGDEATRSRIHGNNVQSLVRATEAELTEYNEYIRAHREYIRGLSELVAADARKVSSFAQGLGLQAGYVSSWNNAAAARSDAMNMVNIAKADLSTRQSILITQAKAAQAQIDAGWYAAQATAAASQAQSMLGVVGTNIRLEGGAGITNSSSDGESIRYSGDVSRSWGSTESADYTVNENV